MKRILQVLVLLAALALLATAPTAYGAPARASLPDIEDEVMCPTCGVPLSQSFSPQAERQRQFIRDLIERGRTKEQIKQAMVGQFGPDVLALPDPARRGINWAVYLIPGFALVFGGAGVALFLARRRHTTLAAGGQKPTPDLPAEDADRLDHDLERYDV